MAASKGTERPGPGMHIDSALVRELAEMLAESDLTEIEVMEGDRRIRVARTAPAQVMHSLPAAAPAALVGAAPAALDGAVAHQPAAAAAAAERADALRSPMVGTAYLSAEPGSDPFVKVGDRVKPGDTLLIVEAMKVMNPITATSDGIVREILISNAQPIEFDQPLMVIS